MRAAWAGAAESHDILRRAWDFGLKLLLPRPVEINDPAIGGQPMNCIRCRRICITPIK